MQEFDGDGYRAAAVEVHAARRDAARASARLAAAAVDYADTGVVAARRDAAADLPGPAAGSRESSCRTSWRCCCGSSRSTPAGCWPGPAGSAPVCPLVWAAHRGGSLDLDQVKMIDRVARRATEPAHDCRPR